LENGLSFAKRDYVRVSPIANAAEALSLIDSWIEDYNTVHPHIRLGYRSPREYIMLSSQGCDQIAVSRLAPGCADMENAATRMVRG
jgi:Integrase core domain